jgi:hypothetical protein
MRFRLTIALAAVWVTLFVTALLDIRSLYGGALTLVIAATALRLSARRLRDEGKLNPILLEHRGVRYAMSAAVFGMSAVVLVFASLQLWYLWLSSRG